MQRELVRGNPAGYAYAWTCRDDGTVMWQPDPLRSLPRAGHWRVQATPRKRSVDMRRLAKANGWSEEETQRRIAELISRTGSDFYVPRTKKVRQVRGVQVARIYDCPVNSGRVAGDYLREDYARKDMRTLSLRDKVRAAVAAGLIAEEDAPRWAK